MFCLPVISLSDTNIGYIHSFVVCFVIQTVFFFFFTCPGLSPKHNPCRAAPTFFNNHLILPVKTPTPCFYLRKGRGKSATQPHPSLECYSTTHQSFPVCGRFTPLTTTQRLEISGVAPLSSHCTVLEAFRAVGLTKLEMS